MLNLTNKGAQGPSVETSLFGANALFHVNGSSGQIDPLFLDVAKDLGIETLRYPGGTISELYFDLAAPNSPKPGLEMDDRFVGLDAFLEGCRTNGFSATIVIPTSPLLIGEVEPNGPSRTINEVELAKIEPFVTALLEEQDPDKTGLIRSLEVGNEFWSAANMTAAEYGMVCNAIVSEIDRAFQKSGWLDEELPKILVQMANPWSPEFDEGGAFHHIDTFSAELEGLGVTTADYDEQGFMRWWSKIDFANELLINELDQSTRQSIDGLVQHYYYQPSNLELYEDLAGAGFIERVTEIWRRYGFTDAPVYLTEWNTHYENKHETGLRSASALLEQFSNMNRLGIAEANVWPLLHNTVNSISHEANGDVYLTPSGALLKILRENVVGGQLLDISSADQKIEAYGYIKDHQVDLFIASRADQEISYELDLTSTVKDFVSASLARITVDPASVDGVHRRDGQVEYVPDFQDHDGNALFVSSEINNALSLAAFDLTLDPFEIAHFQFKVPENHHFMGTPSDDYIRNDNLDPENYANGATMIFGGQGSDVIIGGTHSEQLFGGDDGDFIEDSSARETLWIITATPFRATENDQDSLFGGRGDDLLKGNAGADYLDGGEGSDVMTGGGGRDTFVFSGGTDHVQDYHPSVDRLLLSFDMMVKHGVHSTEDLPDPEYISGHTRFRFSGDDQIWIKSTTTISPNDWLFEI